MHNRSYCFITNYLTHHQLPFCLELQKATNGRFTFIETELLPDERKKMGYNDLGKEQGFVVRAITEDEKNTAKKIVDESDIVIIGSAPKSYISDRLKNGKITFRCSERIFKKKAHDILRQIKYTVANYPYRNKPLYYLFCSAYASNDYIRCGADEKKFYKWGYFPETHKFDDIEKLIESKCPNSILWVGRFISWKHPEIAINVAEQLISKSIVFKLRIIGTGPLFDSLSEMIINKKLEKYVEILGPKSPDEVRKYMEESEIFLFTSDQNEGWGAVLNEAMNSGCAVIANREIGAVPYLIDNYNNGFVVDHNDANNFTKAAIELLNKTKFRREIGAKAYFTIISDWNAEVAANRFIKLSNLICEGKDTHFSNGICSKANLV